jgi:hypothetical protein
MRIRLVQIQVWGTGCWEKELVKDKIHSYEIQRALNTQTWADFCPCRQRWWAGGIGSELTTFRLRQMGFSGGEGRKTPPPILLSAQEQERPLPPQTAWVRLAARQRKDALKAVRAWQRVGRPSTGRREETGVREETGRREGAGQGQGQAEEGR